MDNAERINEVLGQSVNVKARYRQVGNSRRRYTITGFDLVRSLNESPGSALVANQTIWTGDNPEHLQLLCAACNPIAPSRPSKRQETC